VLAIVLVGGEGTRLRPLTNHLPKPMLPIVEKPMISRIVDWLAVHGVDEVVLALGYKPDAFTDAFPEGMVDGIKISYAIEPSPLDTAGAIRYAADTAGFKSGPVIVVNGDIVTDLNLADLIHFHKESEGLATIALTPVEDPSAYGVVPTDSFGRVLAFIEKPDRDKAPTNLVNAGTYVLDGEMINLIANDRRVSIEREIFPALVERGELFAMASDAYWLDTGTPERFLQAQLDILRGDRIYGAEIEYVERRGDVFLAPGSELEAETKGHVYMGFASKAAPGAFLHDCVIGSGSQVAPWAKVIRSVIMPGAKIQEGAIIENSIVGSYAIVERSASVRNTTIVGAEAIVPAKMSLDCARHSL